MKRGLQAGAPSTRRITMDGPCSVDFPWENLRARGGKG